jgi:hypothetical protein
MKSVTNSADSKGRVTLPGFANAIVIVETISESEYRVRKVEFPEDEPPIELSERDAKKLLEMLENPPEPNAALRRAAKRFKKHYG